MADIYLTKGDYKAALRTADAYLATYPDESRATEMRRIAGESAYGLNDYTSAIKTLEAYKGAAEHPARNAMYKLGMSYFHTQVYSEAAACLGKAV